jgi:LAO/AO transport system kinase
MTPAHSALNRKEISKTISDIEQRAPEILKNLSKYFSASSFKRSTCFTGPAGVGKSSLISCLAPLVAEKNKIAWIACDPSSPETGGSVLGDRIRLSGQDYSDNLYIRSMSTRSTQAFSLAIRDVEIYLENLFDHVWVETAGSGQTQSEVARISGMTVLILQPETGDEIQWMKSGVREWADLFIVNKSDLPGAESMAKSLIEEGAPEENVLLASAKTGSGLPEVIQAIENFQNKMNWNDRQNLLHHEHAKALFLEREIVKIQASFEGKKGSLVNQPYQSF